MLWNASHKYQIKQYMALPEYFSFFPHGTSFSFSSIPNLNLLSLLIINSFPSRTTNNQAKKADSFFFHACILTFP